MAGLYTRGSFVRISGAAIAGAALAGRLPEVAAASEPDALTADQALRLLMAGNRRFAAGKPRRPNQGRAHRSELVKGQKPFATIFSCVDSRVPPELVFDRGLGDLFVIRTAGETLDRAALGSIEFGVEELGIPLLVVLGHESCGAVKATIDAVDKGATPSGPIGYLIEKIKPAVERTKGKPGDDLDNAVIEQARLAAAELKAKAPIAHAISRRKLKVVAARYDLKTGRIRLL